MHRTPVGQNDVLSEPPSGSGRTLGRSRRYPPGWRSMLRRATGGRGQRRPRFSRRARGPAAGGLPRRSALPPDRHACGTDASLSAVLFLLLQPARTDGARQGAADGGLAQVFREAADLGILQLHLSGGEPASRRDLEELVRAARGNRGSM